jgi:FixJ family two-component response regulator
MNTDRSVFVIGDDRDLRDSIAALGRQQGFTVRAFSSAEQYWAEYDAAWRGCVVVDLPGNAASLELLQKLTAKRASMPVIAIAAGADIPRAVRAMQHGAAAFVAKPADDGELGKAIEHALEIDDGQYALRLELAELESRLSTLTPEEIDIFRRLMAGHPNKLISTDLDLGLRTVEMRRANITRKMKADSAPDLARMAILLDILKLQRAG